MVSLVALSIERAARTAYRHDAFQPLYLVSSSLHDTGADVLGLDANGFLSGLELDDR